MQTHADIHTDYKIKTKTNQKPSRWDSRYLAWWSLWASASCACQGRAEKASPWAHSDTAVCIYRRGGGRKLDQNPHDLCQSFHCHSARSREHLSTTPLTTPPRRFLIQGACIELKVNRIGRHWVCSRQRLRIVASGENKRVWKQSPSSKKAEVGSRWQSWWGMGPIGSSECRHSGLQ